MTPQKASEDPQSTPQGKRHSVETCVSEGRRWHLCRAMAVVFPQVWDNDRKLAQNLKLLGSRTS